MTAEHSLAVVRELLRRAILTLGAIPDPDLRFRTGPRTAWPGYIQETRDAYASAPPKVHTFTPTERDLTVFLDVLGWLAWYRQKSERQAETARLFTAWMLGAPMWMLQQRCTTNRRHPASKTEIHRRFDRLVSAIVEHFPVGIQSVAVDKGGEGDTLSTLDPHAPHLADSDLRDLPTSPKFVRAPDAKAYGYDHPLAVAARAEDRESSRSGEKANRRYANAGERKSEKSNARWQKARSGPQARQSREGETRPDGNGQGARPGRSKNARADSDERRERVSARLSGNGNP